MAKIGYARVSSVGQSLKVQLDKLNKAKCTKVYKEKKSGTVARPQLKVCLDYVRKGDVLVVSRLDRLARSTLHLCQIAETLQKKGVALRVIDQNINTGDATGRLVFKMLGAIAQFGVTVEFYGDPMLNSARERARNQSISPAGQWWHVPTQPFRASSADHSHRSQKSDILAIKYAAPSTSLEAVGEGGS